MFIPRLLTEDESIVMEKNSCAPGESVALYPVTLNGVLGLIENAGSIGVGPVFSTSKVNVAEPPITLDDVLLRIKPELSGTVIVNELCVVWKGYGTIPINRMNITETASAFE